MASILSKSLVAPASHTSNIHQHDTAKLLHDTAKLLCLYIRPFKPWLRSQAKAGAPTVWPVAWHPRGGQRERERERGLLRAVRPH